nr:F-box only protein 13 [Ipomoea batatas]
MAEEGGQRPLAGVSGFNFFAMEQGGGDMGSRRNLKRKFQEYEALIFGLDELNQDLLERVLSLLPATSFYRLSSVCKQWKSVADSTTFHLACSDVPSREPWFSSALPSPAPESGNEDSCCNFVPVAASGGLIYFHSESDGFMVSKMELLVLSTLKWRMQTAFRDRCSCGHIRFRPFEIAASVEFFKKDVFAPQNNGR